jgi:DNA topoisomerase-1
MKSMKPEEVTLDDALRLLSLPRVVGHDEAGDAIVAALGPYGPYVRRGEKKDSRSLASEDQVFTVTVPEALALFAQPKFRRARGEGTPPLKTFGNDPVSGKPMVVKQGKFGLYVTDGETNATLRSDDSVETLSEDRAIELLADRRERNAAGGGGGGRGRGKRPGRGAPAKGGSKAPASKGAAAPKVATKVNGGDGGTKHANGGDKKKAGPSSKKRPASAAKGKAPKSAPSRASASKKPKSGARKSATP